MDLQKLGLGYPWRKKHVHPVLLTVDDVLQCELCRVGWLGPKQRKSSAYDKG